MGVYDCVSIDVLTITRPGESRVTSEKKLTAIAFDWAHVSAADEEKRVVRSGAPITGSSNALDATGVNINFWLSPVFSDKKAYRFNSNNTASYPSSYREKHWGFPLRCLAIE